MSFQPSMHELTAVRMRFKEARVKYLPVYYLVWATEVRLDARTESPHPHQVRQVTYTGYLFEENGEFFIAFERYHPEDRVEVHLNGHRKATRSMFGSRVIRWWFKDQQPYEPRHFL